MGMDVVKLKQFLAEIRKNREEQGEVIEKLPVYKSKTVEIKKEMDAMMIDIVKKHYANVEGLESALNISFEEAYRLTRSVILGDVDYISKSLNISKEDAQKLILNPKKNQPDLERN